MDKIETPSGYGAEQLAGGGRGKSRVRLALLAVAALCGAAAIYWACRPGPPVYKGRPITAWQDDWAARKNQDWPAAVRFVGTNAIPYTVRNLALNDSSLRTHYAKLQRKLPLVMQIFLKPPKPLLQEVEGANVFVYVGSNSIPYAIAALNHESPMVRRSAAWGLGGLRRQSPAANQGIPALIKAIGDKDGMVRFIATLSLQEMGQAASNAVPSLTGLVVSKSEEAYVQAAAASALGKIGQAASNALPALNVAVTNGVSFLRGQAAVAVWRISSNSDFVVPILLQEMPINQEDNKWDWIIALGEMGPRAKGAIPQLKKELETDHHDWVLKYVTNALRSIDPEGVDLGKK